jgi:DNA-binding transcriptional regulator YdaS (Cro superfamily)
MSIGVDSIIQEAINSVGGTANLAQRLGIQAPSIYSWKRVPPSRVLAVEAATGISRHALRPDLYPVEENSRRPRSRRKRIPSESATPPPREPIEAAE